MMRQKPGLWIIPIAVLLILGASYWWLMASRQSQPRPSVSPTSSVEAAASSFASPAATPVASPALKTVRASDLANVAEQYNYSVQIPVSWEAEVVKEIEAINFYDPAAAGATNLEKSQIFVRYFRANDFLTLSTVTILERQALTVQGRPAVRYVIEKKPSVVDFANQPSWRNQKHVVTDIRASDASPSIFYVIAARPTLPDATYQAVLKSVTLE